MPWKCPSCGYENPDDASSCINCGFKKEEIGKEEIGLQQSFSQTQQTGDIQIQSQLKPAQIIDVQSQQKYYLLFIKTPYKNLVKNKKIPLNFDIVSSILIGRQQDSDIYVPDPRVSRRHAVISLEGGELYIEDLNTTFGTYLYDGKTFQPVKGKQKITPGSTIKLGKETIIKIISE